MEANTLIFWKEVETDLETKVPAHVKNCLHLSGYSDGGTIQLIDKDTLNTIEEFIKTKGMSMIEGKADSIYFLGEYFVDSTESFEFSPGERSQILKISDHLKVTSNSKSNEQSPVVKKRRKKNAKFDHTEAMYVDELNGWLFRKKTFQSVPQAMTRMKMEAQSNLHQDIQSNQVNQMALNEATKKLLMKTVHQDHWMRFKCLFDDSLFSVRDDYADGVLRGAITCIFCKEAGVDKAISVCLKIYSGEKQNNGYWVISNFAKHIKTKHAWVKDPLDENTVNSRDYEQLEAAEEEHVEYIIEEVNEEDEAEVSEGDVLVEPVYSQILEQIQKVKQQQLDTTDMKFRIPSNSQTRALKLFRTNPDGSCLFQAISHQLFVRANDRAAKTSTSKLRREAVKYIKEHYDDFKIQLKNSVYDRQLCNSVELSESEMEKACHDFLYIELPKARCWAGSETIIALSVIYEVNIIVFNEDDSVYCANGFNSDYVKSICIAYRLADTVNTVPPKRNHYDSVTFVDDNDIYDIAEFIMKRSQTVHIEIDSTFEEA